jgi:2-polyprenyl-6-methoxyphenol hydroxylase-like FAD-dependent oxidoreductase
VVAGSRVAVVGGSVAGCAAAVALQRVGCRVEVFERTRGRLEERGAGIILPLQLLDQLVAGGYVGAGLRRVPGSERVWLARDDAAPAGRVVWRQPMAAAANNWALVWTDLRARVPDSCYHEGTAVRRLEPDGDGVTVRLEDGRRERFDAVVGADGYRSAVRAHVDGRPRPAYAGYVLWRGGCAPEALPDAARALLTDAWLTCGFPGGHLIMYLIPRHGTGAGSGTWVNWAVYTPAPDGESFTDPASLPPGTVAREAREFLFPLLARVLPPDLADTTRRASPEDVYLQPIYDLEMPAYVAGRILLAGDAGTVACPHTAAGAAKALQDALALEQAAGAHGGWAEAGGRSRPRHHRAERVGLVPVPALARVHAGLGPRARLLEPPVDRHGRPAGKGVLVRPAQRGLLRGLVEADRAGHPVALRPELVRDGRAVLAELAEVREARHLTSSRRCPGARPACSPAS